VDPALEERRARARFDRKEAKRVRKQTAALHKSAREVAKTEEALRKANSLEKLPYVKDRLKPVPPKKTFEKSIWVKSKSYAAALKTASRPTASAPPRGVQQFSGYETSGQATPRPGILAPRPGKRSCGICNIGTVDPSCRTHR